MQPFEAIRPALNQVGAQLTIQAREWYLAEVIRIAMADGPLTESERHAALAIGVDLGMTQAQVVGVVAVTEQSAGRDLGGHRPPARAAIPPGTAAASSRYSVSGRPQTV